MLTQIPYLHEISKNSIGSRGGKILLESDSWGTQGKTKQVKVKLSLAQSGHCFGLFFQVEEDEVLARYTLDQEPVWQDSCVEIFFSLAAQNTPRPLNYVNLECNPFGAVYCAFGSERNNRKILDPGLVASIKRESDWPQNKEGWFTGPHRWTVYLEFGKDFARLFDLDTFAGQILWFNAYKCGDQLNNPHYISWQPIDSPRPDFHRPEFFKPVPCALQSKKE